mgnify:CR=1 FL=1
MGNETRATMIEGAIQLLATRGVHGASLLKVLEHTGAPRGSVYHHFPGGKEELILAALDLTGQRHDRFVDRFRGTSAEEITAGYLELWRRILVRSRLESGAQSSPSPSRHPPVRCWTVPGRSSGPLNGTSSTSTRRSAFSVPPRSGFVTFLVASAEGAVVLARAARHRALRGSRRPADRASSGDAKGGVDDRGPPGTGDEHASERRRLLTE